jgi:hypothetical protein
MEVTGSCLWVGKFSTLKKKGVGFFIAAIEINGTVTEGGHCHKMKP